MAGGPGAHSSRSHQVDAGHQEDHRAMELIAGSRIVKAQQRVQAAVPYSEQITEVVKDLAAAGGSSDSPLLLGRDDSHNLLRRDLRRPWIVRRLQRRSAACC